MLQQTAFFGMFGYLAAYLMQRDHLLAHDLAFPLVLRTTATGLFATSNQLGIVGGATVGGVLLAWGGFPWLGWFYGGVSMLAAVVLHMKVQDAVVCLVPRAFRHDSGVPKG